MSRNRTNSDKVCARWCSPSTVVSTPSWRRPGFSKANTSASSSTASRPRAIRQGRAPWPWRAVESTAKNFYLEACGGHRRQGGWMTASAFPKCLRSPPSACEPAPSRERVSCRRPRTGRRSTRPPRHPLDAAASLGCRGAQRSVHRRGFAPADLWAARGPQTIRIKIVGRARRLTLNYRTTAQNLHFAVSILSGAEYKDLEQGEESAEDYRSALGPNPRLLECSDHADELDKVADQVREWLALSGDSDEPAVRCCRC